MSTSGLKLSPKIATIGPALTINRSRQVFILETLWVVRLHCFFWYAVVTQELFGPIDHLFNEQCAHKFSDYLDYVR